MPKKLIKRFLPNHHAIKRQKYLRMFGDVLHDPNLWHLNRRSASGAFGVGLFYAFWPVPFQMWLSAATSIPLRVNLPLSVATVWITNPFTMPPIFYFAYRVGAAITGTDTTALHFELSWGWLQDSLGTIGPTFLLGCAVCSVVSGLAGYFVLDWVWRFSVRQAWRRRRKKRQTSLSQDQ